MEYVQEALQGLKDKKPARVRAGLLALVSLLAYEQRQLLRDERVAGNIREALSGWEFDDFDLAGSTLLKFLNNELLERSSLDVVKEDVREGFSLLSTQCFFKSLKVLTNWTDKELDDLSSSLKLEVTYQDQEITSIASILIQLSQFVRGKVTDTKFYIHDITQNRNLGLDSDLFGTTVVAFIFAHGVIVACESRCSNEWVKERGPKWKLEIEDDYYKVVHVSNEIVNVMIGSKDDNQKILDNALYYSSVWKDAKRNDDGKPLVRSTTTAVKNHCQVLKRWGRLFGGVTAGYDKERGYQISLAYTYKGKVFETEEGSVKLQAGSGASHAEEVLKLHHHNLSVEDAKMLAVRAIAHGNYYSGGSGGPIQVIHIQKDCKINESSRDPLRDFYETYKDPTFFLVYDYHTGQLTAADITANFRQYGEVRAAHQVAVCSPENQKIYFHRLVFRHEEAASKLATEMKMNPHNVCDDPSFCYKKFSYTVIVNDVLVFVRRASVELLDTLIDSKN